jgi:hypothetical protein
MEPLINKRFSLDEDHVPERVKEKFFSGHRYFPVKPNCFAVEVIFRNLVSSHLTMGTLVGINKASALYFFLSSKSFKN